MKFAIQALVALCVLFSSNLFSSAANAEFSIDEWKTRVDAEQSVDRLGRLYLELLLEENPTSGMGFGIHGKGEDHSYYDRRLPDTSVAQAEQYGSARVHLQEKLEAMDAAGLSRPDQIDLHILKKRVALDQMQVTRLDSLTSPLGRVTTLGGAMSGLVLRDYAPLEERLVSFGTRCAATGGFLEGIQTLLLPPGVLPGEMNKTLALSRLQGMTREGGLYDKTLPELIGLSSLDEQQAGNIKSSCAQAVEKIKAFATWFEATIMPRENGEWRIGRKLYDEKYDLQLDYPLNPDELLLEAEKWLEQKGGELVSVGRKIHDEYLAAEIAAGSVQKASDLDDRQVVQGIFSKMSEDRSSVDSLISDSYEMADGIVNFVREQNLMDLPPTSKLRIEPIPPHLAGSVVAMIETAPPFEPELESVWFWDLEFLAGAEDFLKEYNRPTLAMVYIHEGVPGHFVQLEYSNQSERIMPKVFWNGAMVEGWASYIATQLVAEGFTVYPDNPLGHELQQMVDDKLILRAIINAIIDLKLQRSDWPEEAAVKLMVDKGFQEQSEAAGKLVRAKLSSVQLASYFAGHLAIETILAEYREKMGSAFSWKEFNERLVGAGSPPFFAIREYMLEPASD